MNPFTLLIHVTATPEPDASLGLTLSSQSPGRPELSPGRLSHAHSAPGLAVAGTAHAIAPEMISINRSVPRPWQSRRTMMFGGTDSCPLP